VDWSSNPLHSERLPEIVVRVRDCRGLGGSRTQESQYHEDEKSGSIPVSPNVKLLEGGLVESFEDDCSTEVKAGRGQWH
jgi:hypothetical protein